MEQMLQQAKNVGATVLYSEVVEVNLANRPFWAKDSDGNEYKASSIIISTGAQAKWLGLDSEKKYKGYGVSGCATCDGFFYSGKDVLVVGGGNTAAEEALFLTKYANNVTLIHRGNKLRADKTLQERLKNNPKITILFNHVLEEVLGKDEPNKEVTGARIKNQIDNTITNKNVEGIFIAIGHKPNTELFKQWINTDEYGYIITEPGSTITNVKGVFAAGDCQDKIYRQAVTAAGTGCMAALDAEKLIES